MVFSLSPSSFLSFRRAALILVAASCLSPLAKADQTITFDDLPANGSIPANYDGFNWGYFGVSTGGYTDGLVSGANDIYNTFAATTSITSLNGAFTLGSIDMTAAYFNPQSVTVTGFDTSGHQIDQIVLSLVTSPTLETFNWSNLGSVQFNSNGVQVVLDNFTVGSVAGPATVPDAGSTGMLIVIGLGGLAALRRRQAQA